MGYKRFIESGRVCLVNSGKYAGKLIVIADVVNQARVLAENPIHKVPRQQFRYQELNLTDIKIKLPCGARTGAVRKAYTKEDVDAQWQKTTWAQKLKVREDKKTMNDFERFKSKVARQIRNRKIKALVKTMKKK